MTIRTTRHPVSFNEPFKLVNAETLQPAGDYILVQDDELIEGLSHPAYRRVTTLLQAAPHLFESEPEGIHLTQTEFDTVLMRDKNQTIRSS